MVIFGKLKIFTSCRRSLPDLIVPMSFFFSPSQNGQFECSVHFFKCPCCSSLADFPPFEFDRSYIPSSGIPPDCCWSLFLVSCKWPRSLRERLWQRPRRRNLQIPSIFPCKYRPPSKSPREGKRQGERKRKKNRQIVFSKVFMERLFTLGLWWYGIPENSFQNL